MSLEEQIPELSLVIPTYNEEDSLAKLVDEIYDALNSFRFEILFVNDGSTDNTLNVLKGVQIKYNDNTNELKIVNLRRNSGQTAAMRAGFQLARGKYTVTLDSDGQNDPSDIVRLYNKLKSENVDVVCGWRKNRHDPLSKRIPSKLSNFLHRRLTGLKINDSGCTLRIYDTKAVRNLPIHGEDHRFLPAIIYSRGFSVTELEVNHRPRIDGQSKYGFSRLFRGYFDLISTAFVYKIGVKPFQFFAKIALFPFILGTLILSYLTYAKFGMGQDIGERPLLLLGVLLEIFAIQFFLSGLIAEVLSTHNSVNFKQYSIKEVLE